MSSNIAGGGGGMSTISTETVTGWYVLQVEGYSQLKGLRVRNLIKSATFSVGGHSWYIALLPDTPIAESIWFGMHLDHPADGSSNNIVVQAWPKFSILDRAGEPVHLAATDIYAWKFSSAQSLVGFYRGIKRVELESCYLKDDSFKIRCDVTVFKEIHVESTVDSITVPPPDLHRHLADLLASDVGADVTFEVGEETFTTHKYMLAARSSVFKAELFVTMKEKAKSHVRIDDMEPRVFKAMLHFIYTDMLPVIGSEEKIIMAQHLLVATDRYSMERLKLICEDVLCKHTGIDIAVTTLVLAEQHDCRGLKEACFKFFRRPGNLKAVMASDGFQHLKNSCPCLLEELLATVAP